MHLKNFSLIETDQNSQQYILSAAYDLLPVNIILPEDPDQMALTLDGKRRNITRNDEKICTSGILLACKPI